MSANAPAHKMLSKRFPRLMFFELLRCRLAHRATASAFQIRMEAQNGFSREKKKTA
jgi:hypothetical protein